MALGAIEAAGGAAADRALVSSPIAPQPTTPHDALGNSLNVPAVTAVQFTGRSDLQLRLRELGIESLSEHPDFYGDGLALGNGELSLFELVRAYIVLAGSSTPR